jgi:hypothetical protein
MSSNTKNDDDDVDDSGTNNPGGDTTDNSSGGGANPASSGTKEENASSKSLNFFYVMAIFVTIYFIGGLVTFYYGKNKPSDHVLYRKCLTNYIFGALLASGFSAGAIVVFEGENPKVNVYNVYNLIPFTPAILTLIWLCVSRVANNNRGQ